MSNLFNPIESIFNTILACPVVGLQTTKSGLQMSSHSRFQYYKFICAFHLPFTSLPALRQTQYHTRSIRSRGGTNRGPATRPERRRGKNPLWSQNKMSRNYRGRCSIVELPRSPAAPHTEGKTYGKTGQKVQRKTTGGIVKRARL